MGGDADADADGYVVLILKFLESEEMHFTQYGLGLKGTRALVDALKDLSGNRLATAGGKALAKLITVRSSPLCSINLSNTKMSDKDGALIIAAIENNSTLKSLDLSNNDLGDKSAIALGSVLPVNICLVDLSLSWNKLRPKGVCQVAEGLKPNLTLQILGLAWCGMQDQGAIAFGAVFKINNGAAAFRAVFKINNVGA
eukprot:gene29026-32222_t